MKQNPGKIITDDLLASVVGQAYPIAFIPVNVLSGFKFISLTQVLLMTDNWCNLLKFSLHCIQQCVYFTGPEDKVQPTPFSPEEEICFQKRFEKVYDVQDEEYTCLLSDVVMEFFMTQIHMNVCKYMSVVRQQCSSRARTSPLHTQLESQQLLAMRGVASAIIGTGSKSVPLPSAHAYGTNGMNYISMFCEHALLIDA